MGRIRASLAAWRGLRPAGAPPFDLHGTRPVRIWPGAAGEGQVYALLAAWRGLRPASAPPLGLRGARPALIWPEAAGRRRSRRPSRVGDRVRGRSAVRRAWEREGWPSAARGGRLGGEERNETLNG